MPHCLTFPVMKACCCRLTDFALHFSFIFLALRDFDFSVSKSGILGLLVPKRTNIKISKRGAIGFIDLCYAASHSYTYRYKIRDVTRYDSVQMVSVKSGLLNSGPSIFVLRPESQRD